MNYVFKPIFGLLLGLSLTIHAMEQPQDNQPSKKHSHEEMGQSTEITKKQKIELSESQDQLITLIGNDGKSVQIKRSIICLSPTIQELIKDMEAAGESLENGIPFNNITGAQLEAIKKILELSVKQYGYSQVTEDFKDRKNLKNEQYFLDDVIKYLALHKELLTSDLYGLFNYLDLPLFKWVMAARIKEARMNLPFVMSKPEIGTIITEYLVDENFEEIQNYIIGNLNLLKPCTELSLTQPYVLNVDWKNNIVLYDTATKKKLYKLPDLEGKLSKYDCSPDGNYIAIRFKNRSDEFVFNIWDVQAEKYINEFKINGVSDYFWSPDSSYIILELIKNEPFKKEIKILNISTKELLKNFVVSSQALHCFWAPNSKYFGFLTGYENDLQLYSITNKSINKVEFPELNKNFTEISWSPDSKYFGLRSEYSQDFKLYAIDNENINKIDLLTDHTKFKEILWAPDSSKFLAIYNDDMDGICAEIYDIKTKKWVVKNTESNNYIWTEDSKHIINITHVGTNLSLLQIFDALTFQCIMSTSIKEKISYYWFERQNNATQLCFKIERDSERSYVKATWDFAFFKKIVDYFKNSIYAQEIILLSAIQRAHAQGKLYEMGPHYQTIFNNIAQNDRQVGYAIRKVIIPWVKLYAPKPNYVLQIVSFLKNYLNSYFKFNTSNLNQ